MKREPVMVAQIVATLMSVLSLLVAFEVINILPEQMAQVEQTAGAVLALVWPVAAAWFGRSKVTPVADPRL